MSDAAIAIICSSIVSIISVIIPLITTIKSNRHNKLMKELELNYENKINAYKEFFSEYGKYVSITNYINLQQLGEKVSKALMFSSQKVREKLLIILDYCEHSDNEKRDYFPQIKDAYREIVPLIAEELASSKNFNGRKHK